MLCALLYAASRIREKQQELLKAQKKVCTRKENACRIAFAFDAEYNAEWAYMYVPCVFDAPTFFFVCS